MGRLLHIGWATLLAVGCAGTLPAQSASVEVQFAEYHRALNGRAESLLTLQSDPGIVMKLPVEAPVGEPSIESIPALRRLRQLLPILEPILQEEGVPRGLAAVVAVESGVRSTALSSKGALGLWQLMPETARRYGLQVTESIDERTDTIKATRAAARYLRDLYAQFGNWQLAFAAYNAGEGTILRAIAKSGNRDFEGLRSNRLLPLETSNYVPAVLSVMRALGQSLPQVGEGQSRFRNGKAIYAQGGFQESNVENVTLRD